MSRKKFTTEKFIRMLRDVEIGLMQMIKVVDICLQREAPEQLRDELLNREVFFALKGAKVTIEKYLGSTSRPRHTGASTTDPWHQRLSCFWTINRIG